MGGLAEIGVASLFYYTISIAFVFGLVFGFFRRALRWVLPRHRGKGRK